MAAVLTALPGFAGAASATAVRAILPGFRASASLGRRTILPGFRGASVTQSIISAGTAQTVEAGQLVLLDASLTFGVPPDSYVWDQLLPAAAVVNAYETAWGVPYPQVVFGALTVGGDCSYVAPAVYAKTDITLRLRGVKAGLPDTSDLVVHTLLTWPGPWRARANSFPFLVAELPG